MEKSFEQLNMRVEGVDEKSFGEGEEEKEEEKGKEQKEEFSEELERYRKEGQKMIDSYGRFFMTFAKDVSLDFKMSDGFYIDLENGEVNLDTKWFAEKDFSKDQILWANLHELAHFRDLSRDPKKMMENFEHIRGQAKKTGAVMMNKWEEKYGDTDPEFIENLKKQRIISKKDPSKTMNAVEQAAYKIHHSFYNIFDDIYVNNLVARKAPKYEEGEKGGKEIEKLYKEKLFAQNNYSKIPRHLQFLYKLIKEEMVKDKKMVLSNEVADIMDEKVKFQGKEHTPKGIVDNFIKPKSGRDTKAGQRYFVLQRTLEPIFEELLAKDLEEWEPKKPKRQKRDDLDSGSEAGMTEGEEEEGKEGGKGEQDKNKDKEKGEPSDDEENGEGSVNPFEQDYEAYDENNPSQISDGDIEDWMDKNEEDKKEEKEREAKEKEEESKTAEEKADEAQEKMDVKWREKNKIDAEAFRQFKKIEAEVEPYLADLSKLWQRIIFGSSRAIKRGVEGHFKTGTELDIPRVIEEWPKIEKGELEEARVMKKMVSKEILIRKPELIRVRLVGDMSGSMDESKKRILQQCFVLLLSSLREFNTYLNFSRSRTKSKLEADTEAWIFGDSAERIKKLRSESGNEEEQVEIIKVFEKLRDTIGGTYDNKALEAIFESLSPEDREKIGQEKIMEIVFEITDGGSLAPNEAKRAVSDLAEAGVIVRAFQIGAVSDDEKKTFNEVWNKGREEKLGEVVGEKIENLLPAITGLLKKYMKGVRL